MNKETTTFTVRTSPEIKNGIENIISEIMADQGISSKGEAFGLLTEAFREYRTTEMTPEYKEQLKTVKNLLNTVYSTVLSITDLSTLTIQEKQKEEEQKKEQLEERNRDLELKIRTQENTINRYEEEIKKLRNQLDQAQKELIEKKNIDTILSKLDSLERMNA